MSQTSSGDQPIRQLLYPYLHQKEQQILRDGSRFVHYTSAQVAHSIVAKKQIWMRNTTTMNDMSEVEHGISCLARAYDSDVGKYFQRVLEECHPGLSKEVTDQFNGWLPAIRNKTYIACFSEHLATENEHGRLSMWRAYGGQSGVAIVINPDAMFVDASALGVVASPVFYADEKEFAEYMLGLTNSMKSRVGEIRKLGRSELRDEVFNIFRYAALCTKHPGFHEEREWRVLCTPELYPSTLVTSDIEVVHGIPQKVMKLTLTNYEDHDGLNLSIPNLVERVIIGPTQFPEVVRNATIEVLEKAGVDAAINRIFVTGIPLRP